MASNYRKSSYAINKVREGIVYRNADGSILEITFEKIATDNPSFTIEDFKKLKQFSDDLYHEEEKGDNLQAHYVKSLFDENVFGESYSVPSFEDELIKQNNEIYFTAMMEGALNTLTQTQRRRLLMAYIKGLSAREIARLEGANHKSVLESLNAAKRKIKKFLKDF